MLTCGKGVLRFDWTINFGTILNLIGWLFAAAVFFVRHETAVKVLRTALEHLEGTVNKVGEQLEQGLEKIGEIHTRVAVLEDRGKRSGD